MIWYDGEAIEILARRIFEKQREHFRLSPLPDHLWRREYRRDPLLKLRAQAALRSVIEDQTVREHVLKIIK